MAEDLRPEELPAFDYEGHDVDPPSVVRAGLVLGGIAAFGAAVSVGLFLLLRQAERRADPAPPPLGVQERGRLPPAPRLQAAPAVDLLELRGAQRRDLEGYGWVDRERGIAHVPIEEAMKRYVEQAGAGAPPPEDER